MLVALGSKSFAACRQVLGGLMVLTAVASPALANTCHMGHVPEIDPGMLTSALTMLVGGALMVADRFRR
jgi:hypothetical protein